MKTLLLMVAALTMGAIPYLTVQADDKPEEVTVQKIDLAEMLQLTSVTIKAGNSQGSGTLVNRVVDGEVTTFVWTAAHVVDGLRKTRSVIADGSTKTVIEFADARIVQELVQNGRRVGEVQMDAQVVRYSDADHGEDLALLLVRKTNILPLELSTQFYLGDEIPPIGTDLLHVGSLKGQIGANSMTTGIVSQIGRVLNVGSEVVFDQTTVTAFPGSSGGGVYLKGSGEYVGMLVRGSGEQFNFIVPIRRMQRYAREAGIEWALDPSVPVPSLSTIRNMPLEQLQPYEPQPTPAKGLRIDDNFLIAPLVADSLDVPVVKPQIGDNRQPLIVLLNR